MNGIVGLVVFALLLIVFVRSVDRLTEMSREQKEMVKAIRRIESQLAHLERTERPSVEASDTPSAG